MYDWPNCDAFYKACGELTHDMVEDRVGIPRGTACGSTIRWGDNGDDGVCVAQLFNEVGNVAKYTLHSRGVRRCIGMGRGYTRKQDDCKREQIAVL